MAVYTGSVQETLKNKKDMLIFKSNKNEKNYTGFDHC